MYDLMKSSSAATGAGAGAGLPSLGMNTLHPRTQRLDFDSTGGNMKIGGLLNSAKFSHTKRLSAYTNPALFVEPVRMSRAEYRESKGLRPEGVGGGGGGGGGERQIVVTVGVRSFGSTAIH